MPKTPSFHFISLRKPGYPAFPVIPIALVYSFSGMNDSFMDGGIGGQYIPQYNISADMLLCVLLNLLCPVHIYRLTILKVFFDLTLITLIIITMIHTVTCHVCHLWIKPMSRLSLVDKAHVIGKIHAGAVVQR